MLQTFSPFQRLNDTKFSSVQNVRYVKKKKKKVFQLISVVFKWWFRSLSGALLKYCEQLTSYLFQMALNNDLVCFYCSRILWVGRIYWYAPEIQTSEVRSDQPWPRNPIWLTTCKKSLKMHKLTFCFNFYQLVSQ